MFEATRRAVAERARVEAARDRYFAEFMAGFTVAAGLVAAGRVERREAEFSRDTTQRLAGAAGLETQAACHGFEAALDCAVGAGV
jgi:hypothetical protein